MLRQWIEGLKASTPGQCAVCHAWPAQPLCEDCVARFAQPQPRCATCALPVPAGLTQCGHCARSPPALDGCFAAVAYAYPWSGLITQFKFHNQPGWAQALATLMRSAPWIEPAIEAADVLLPMPLAASRLAGRGFNQALELARYLAPAKVRSSLLLRVRDTPAQVALDRAQRLANMKNAFAVEPMLAATLRGKHALLVDDVMTSGASLASAALALRQAGAARVTAVVLARTDEPQ
ncbi:MAG: ComF family protein [Ramlibacter sp.]